MAVVLGPSNATKGAHPDACAVATGVITSMDSRYCGCGIGHAVAGAIGSTGTNHGSAAGTTAGVGVGAATSGVSTVWEVGAAGALTTAGAGVGATTTSGAFSTFATGSAGDPHGTTAPL